MGASIHPFIFFRYIPRWSCGGAELCRPIYNSRVFPFRPFFELSLGSKYSFQSSWIWCHKVCTPGFDKVLWFLSADALKACQVGWGLSVDDPFFRSLWTCLIGLRSGLQLGHSRTCCLGSVLILIVFLVHLIIFFFKVYISPIQLLLSPEQSLCPWGWKTTPCC